MTTSLHQNKNLPASAHALEHKISKLEECYSFKHEEHSYRNINDAKLKNIQIAPQLI